MAATGEKAPLLGNGGDNQNYYFLASHNRDGDEGETVEDLPEGATAEEFAPRVLGTPVLKGSPRSLVTNGSAKKKGGFFANLFGASSSQPEPQQIQLKPRKAPIKIEPKVFFANERTFLAWMHVSIILAGASIAILAFSNKKSTPGSQIYGLIMLPVAVSFIIYSMYQYTRRAYMIRNKHPGPYDDTVGPTVLGIILMMSIVSQFVIKLNAIVS